MFRRTLPASFLSSFYNFNYVGFGGGGMGHMAIATLAFDLHRPQPGLGSPLVLDNLSRVGIYWVLERDSKSYQLLTRDWDWLDDGDHSV